MMIRSLRLIFMLLISCSLPVGCATNISVKTPYQQFITDKIIGMPDLSPDGQNLVFSIESESDSKLYMVSLKNTDLKTLTKDFMYSFDPVFSPDGKRILFCRVTNGQGDICEMKSDGSDIVCLTSGPEHDYEPIYSPDGRKIYFLRAKEFRNYSPIARTAWHDIDIYSINSDGTGLKNITSESYYRLHTLSIDGSGEVLMVSATGQQKGIEETKLSYGIRLIPIKTPDNSTILRPNLEKYSEKTLFWKHDIDYGMILNARFSPTGDNLVFTWPSDNSMLLMNLKTGAVNKIWERKSRDIGIGRMYPKFSRNGDQIIFGTTHNTILSTKLLWERHSVSNLWIMNIDGSGLKAVEVK